MVKLPDVEREKWHADLSSIYKIKVMPHCQNLLHQCTPKSAAHAKSFKALKEIIPAYLEMIKVLKGFNPNDIKKSVAQCTAAFEKYMCVLRKPENDLFSSVSDLKTSAIPEFLLILCDILIAYSGVDFLEVTGQQEIPVELSFDIRVGDFVVVRRQRVDVAIVKPVSLVVDDAQLEGFSIPIFAAEVKTYFDKNMLSGVDQSADGMKRTFPHCLYFSISEFADFEIGAYSYASGAMDEIFILRHQKRADWRKTSSAKPIDHILVFEILKRVNDAILNCNKKRSKLDERMKTGKLIG